ncbi:hypothetical protein FACS189418_8420 [Clostridia bacterium]|nr:hypothetical protein FACS189418_8420 [Clostridia bacterium]
MVKNSKLTIPDDSEITHFVDEYEPSLLLAIKKGLTQGLTIDSYYLALQSLYRYALESYLDSRLNISLYEKQIEENALNFIPKIKEDQSLEQKYSQLHAQYFYVINAIHIEYLNKQDLQILKKRLKEKNVEIDEELLSLIQRTYQNEKVLGLDIRTFYSHLRLSSSTGGISNALSLGIAFSSIYDEQDISMEDELWRIRVEHVENMQAFVNELIPEMEESFSKALGSPVGVFCRKY